MKAYKKLAVGVLLFTSLSMTACAQDVPSDANPVPADKVAVETTPTTDETKSPAVEGTDAPVVDSNGEEVEISDPSAVVDEDLGTDNPLGVGQMNEADAKEYMDNLKASPMGVDMDVLFEENIADDLLTVFPEEQFNTKEGVRSALEFYGNLNSLTNFHEKRDATKDFALIAPYADRVDAEFLKFIENDIKEKGQFGQILTVPGSGVISYGGEDYEVVPQSLRVSFNHPGVQVSATGDEIYLEGTRSYTYDLVGGEVFEGSYTYWITTKPTTDGKWIVTAFSYGGDNNSTAGLKGE